MYPRFSDLLNDLLGTHIVLPIQMFGFMFGMSFLAAAICLYYELKRKHALGLIPKVKVTYTKGASASVSDLLSAAFFGFIIGFKGVHAIFHYGDLIEDTQGFLLSWQGNWLAGIIGAAALAFYQYRESAKHKLDTPEVVTEWLTPDRVTGNFTMNAMVGGIIGAKMFHIFENMDDFYRDPFDAIVSFSGLTLYGGLIIAAITILWYARKLNIRSLHISDAIVPGLMLAIAVGRLGCQLSGDGDWGIENTAAKPSWLSAFPDWVWSYDYPHNVLSEGVAIPGCSGHFCNKLPVPVFPTPLYEFVWLFILFLIMWFGMRKIKIAGIMTCAFLILNGSERWFIEKIRINNKAQYFGFTLTQAEFIALLMMLSGVVWLVYLLKNKSKYYMLSPRTEADQNV